MLLVPHVIIAAAQERRLELDLEIAARNLKKCKDARATAQKQLKQKPFGSFATFMSDLTQLEYQDFLNAHPHIEQRTLQILDLFEHPSDDQPEIRQAAHAFKDAAADPHDQTLWRIEYQSFIGALATIAKEQLGDFTFEPHLTERIVANHRKIGTLKQYTELAALHMVEVAREQQRFIAMNRNGSLLDQLEM
jgi:hypothetical protein